MCCRRLLVLVCLVFLAQSSYGDELFFKNGDHLTGKIKYIVDGKLVFESDVAGEMKIDIVKIRTFSADQTSQAQVSNLDAASSVNPPIKPKAKWAGDMTIGITSVHGNTKTEGATASVKLSKRTETDRTALSADYAKTEQEDRVTGKDEVIEDWWRAKAKYDYFFTKKFFGYLDGRYEKDAIAELDRRVVVGGGGGYQWIESEDMNFSTEIGLASLYEKFDNQTNSNSEMSAQLGYNFDKKLKKNIRFIHELTYYPSLEQFSDYFLTSTAEIRADFTETMFMSFKAILDYDASPAIGTHKTDTKYTLGVGYRF
jgi:putative salt-induced outer membrane protein YdiY